MSDKSLTEGSSSLDRAAALLAGWDLSIPEGSNPKNISAIHRKTLQVANPEAILADILDIFPDMEESVVAEAFKAGILERALDKNISGRTDEYASVEELSMFAAMASISAYISSDSPALNDYIASQKETLSTEEYRALCLRVVDVINKALVTRTLVFENFPLIPGKAITTEILPPLAAQLGDETNFGYMDYRYLGHCLSSLNNPPDLGDDIKARITSLIDRADAVKLLNGKHYNPHILIPTFISGGIIEELSIEEQLDLADTQIKYIEEVAGLRSIQRREEEDAAVQAKQLEEQREEREKGERMERELAGLLEEIKQLESNIVLVTSNELDSREEGKNARDVESKVSEMYRLLVRDLSRVTPSSWMNIFNRNSVEEELNLLITKVDVLIMESTESLNATTDFRAEKREAVSLTKFSTQHFAPLNVRHNQASLKKEQLETDYGKKCQLIGDRKMQRDFKLKDIETSIKAFEAIKKALEDIRTFAKERSTTKEKLFLKVRQNIGMLTKSP